MRNSFKNHVKKSDEVKLKIAQILGPFQHFLLKKPTIVILGQFLYLHFNKLGQRFATKYLLGIKYILDGRISKAK